MSSEDQVYDIPNFLRKHPSVFSEAEEIISGDREATYGHPAKNLTATAILWAAHIEAKYGIKIPLDHDDVAWMMANLKQARAMHMYKRDNIVDAIGYIGLVPKIRDFNKKELAAQINKTANELKSNRKEGVVTAQMGAGRIHHSQALANTIGEIVCQDNQEGQASPNLSSALPSDSASPSVPNSSSSPSSESTSS